MYVRYVYDTVELTRFITALKCTAERTGKCNWASFSEDAAPGGNSESG